MASRPMAKKKLNMNSMMAATIPAGLLPLDTVPARMAMQQDWPMTAKSISLRRPRRSRTQTTGIVERLLVVVLVICCMWQDSKDVCGPRTLDCKGQNSQVSNSVSTGDQQSGVVRHSNTRLENDGGVVRDQVNATELLHELATNTKERPVAETLRAILEERGESGTTGDLLLFV